MQEILNSNQTFFLSNNLADNIDYIVETINIQLVNGGFWLTRII